MRHLTNKFLNSLNNEALGSFLLHEDHNFNELAGQMIHVVKDMTSFGFQSTEAKVRPPTCLQLYHYLVFLKMCSPLQRDFHGRKRP